jgi:hypothetical protein
VSDPQPGRPGPCIYVLSDTVAQLYPQAPCSIFVSFHDSQDYGGNGGIVTRLQTGIAIYIINMNVKAIGRYVCMSLSFIVLTESNKIIDFFKLVLIVIWQDWHR